MVACDEDRCNWLCCYRELRHLYIGRHPWLSGTKSTYSKHVTVKCVNLSVLRIQCTFRWAATSVLQPQIRFRPISINLHSPVRLIKTSLLPPGPETWFVTRMHFSRPPLPAVSGGVGVCVQRVGCVCLQGRHLPDPEADTPNTRCRTPPVDRMTDR